MGRPKKREDTAYAKYVASGGRVLGLHVPAEMNRELELRAKKRGLPLASYVKTALYWYMRNEAVMEERLRTLVRNDERLIGTVEN